MIIPKFLRDEEEDNPVQSFALASIILLCLDMVVETCVYGYLGYVQYGNLESFFRGELTSFKFEKSLFDLILVSLFRGSGVSALFWMFRTHNKKIWIGTCCLMLLGGSLVFAVVKCFFLYHDRKVSLVVTSYVVLSSFFISGLVCLILCSMAIWKSKQPKQKANYQLLHHPDLNINSESAPMMIQDEEEEEGKEEKSHSSVFRIASVAIPEIPMLVVAILMGIVNSISQIVLLVVLTFIFDDVNTNNKSALNPHIYALVVVALIGAVAQFLDEFLMELAGNRLVARLRIQVYKKILELDISFFDQSKSGELSNRISADTILLQNIVTSQLSQFTSSIIQIVGSLLVLFSYSWRLTLVMLSVVPALVIGALIFGNIVEKIQKTFQDLLAKAVGMATESIQDMKTIRTFVREKKAHSLFSRAILESYQCSRKKSVAEAVFGSSMEFLVSGAIALCMWYGATLAFEGQLSSGTLVLFITLSSQFANAVNNISTFYSSLREAVGASEKVFELLDMRPNIPIEGGMLLPPGEGVVRFDKVFFSYPSRKDATVLRDISFTLTPGKITAIVGKSGSGKSTTVQLIMRFYDCNQGTIFYNDVDLRELDPSMYRKEIGYVTQEPTLISASVRENILYGVMESENVAEDVVIAASKLANCHDFIMAFKDGYDTQVGERGVQLSGGQRARIAVARALVTKPRLLILDEATANLDTESEHLVTEAIERAMENRTVLVIAHRLSTVKNADTILVYKEGEIVERGKHEELLENKQGVYHKLIKRQLQKE